jgi:putative FmdB family regulatory protein
MPLYDYNCPDCGEGATVFQTMGESHESRPCGSCGGVARRVWNVPSVFPDNTQSYFNHGLGCVVRSKGDIREAMKRIKGTTGQDLIEVGNEKLKRTDPVRQEYPTASQLGI